MIKLGTRLEEHHQETGAFRILCDDPELIQHLDRPWLRAYACERLGLPVPRQAQKTEAGNFVRPVAATEEQLQRHSVVCGGSGSGKTRLALHMLLEQIRAGASVVMFDPKKETLLHLLVMAREAGIKPQQVTLLVPGSSDEVGVPGWNPLDYKAARTKPSRIASDFVSILRQNNPSWGPRMDDLLTNALIIISSYGLSLFELSRFLMRPDYRAAILATPIEPPEGRAFAEAYEYFTGEFANLSASEQTNVVGPVLNKLRPFLRSEFLFSLLCAKRNTMDFASLWKEQKLILVHLDRVALGDMGAQLLGGLLTWGLYRTAMETEGPVPVCLSMDEMGVSEQFIGSAVCEILAIARSRNLRLLVACQHLTQLSDNLRESLLSNTSVRAFFRLGYPDAQIVARALAAGTGDDVTVVQAEVMSKKDRTTGGTSYVEIPHPIVDGYGNQIRVSESALYEMAARHLDSPLLPVQKAELARSPLDVIGQGSALTYEDRDVFASTIRDIDPLDRLKRLAAYSGIARLYVHAAGSGEPIEVSRYVKGLSSSSYLVGPTPVQIVLRFPRPTFTIVSRLNESEKRDRWTRLLMDLPKQHAVVVLSPEKPAVIKVVSVADPSASAGLSRFMSTALVANGQSLKETEEVYDGRTAQIRETERAYRETLPIEDPAISKRSVKRTLKRPPQLETFASTETEAPKETGVPGPRDILAEMVAPKRRKEIIDDGSID